ncbi:MAG: hypothetical protein WCP20_23615 [Desulfuromonadales bacterium]
MADGIVATPQRRDEEAKASNLAEAIVALPPQKLATGREIAIQVNWI